MDNELLLQITTVLYQGLFEAYGMLDVMQLHMAKFIPLMRKMADGLLEPEELDTWQAEVIEYAIRRTQQQTVTSKALNALIMQLQGCDTETIAAFLAAKDRVLEELVLRMRQDESEFQKKRTQLVLSMLFNINSPPDELH